MAWCNPEHCNLRAGSFIPAHDVPVTQLPGVLCSELKGLLPSEQDRAITLTVPEQRIEAPVLPGEVFLPLLQAGSLPVEAHSFTQCICEPAWSRQSTCSQPPDVEM